MKVAKQKFKILLRLKIKFRQFSFCLFLYIWFYFLLRNNRIEEDCVMSFTGKGEHHHARENKCNIKNKKKRKSLLPSLLSIIPVMLIYLFFKILLNFVSFLNPHFIIFFCFFDAQRPSLRSESIGDIPLDFCPRWCEKYKFTYCHNRTSG